MRLILIAIVMALFTACGSGGAGTTVVDTTAKKVDTTATVKAVVADTVKADTTKKAVVDTTKK